MSLIIFLPDSCGFRTRFKLGIMNQHCQKLGETVNKKGCAGNLVFSYYMNFVDMKEIYETNKVQVIETYIHYTKLDLLYNTLPYYTVIGYTLLSTRTDHF